MLVTWTRFNRWDRFSPKYYAVPLLSFLSLNRLFSRRVSLSSTATSPNVSVMRVPAARLMLGLRPVRWMRSSRWQCCKRSALVKGAKGSWTTSVECVLGPDRILLRRAASQ